jgi:hypothetical protein
MTENEIVLHDGEAKLALRFISVKGQSQNRLGVLQRNGANRVN